MCLDTLFLQIGMSSSCIIAILSYHVAEIITAVKGVEYLQAKKYIYITYGDPKPI